MDQNLKNEGNIIPFNSGPFGNIDYTVENPDDWLFVDELEKEETDLKKENCEKVKIKDMGPIEF